MDRICIGAAMKMHRHLYSLIILIILLVNAYSAHATIPSTQNWSFTGSGCPVIGQSGFGTFDAAASAAIAAFNADAPAPACGPYTSTYAVTSSSTDSNAHTVSVNLSVTVHSPTPSTTNTSASKQIFVAYSCPANYQISGDQLTCTLQATCTKGQTLSSGYYDQGTNSSALPTAWVCVNQCGYSFTGQSGFSNIQNGKRHYAYYGSYDGDGNSCTAPTGQTVPNATTAMPPETCASGQAKGTVNGQTVCVSQSTGQPVNTNDPQTSKSTTTSAPVTNADGSKSVTTTQTNADGSTTTQTTTTKADGSSSTTYGYTAAPTSKTGGDPSVTSTGSSGSGTGTSSSNSPTGTANDPLNVDICSKNPNAPACKQVSAGSAAGTNGIYTKDASGKTFASVINDFKNNMQAAPFYAAVTGFFSGTNIPTGSCTGLSGNVTFPLGHVVNVDMTNVLCGSSANYFYSLLSIGLLLVATFLAFKIAIL